MASSTVHKILRQKTVSDHLQQFVFNIFKVSMIFGVVIIIVVFPGGVHG